MKKMNKIFSLVLVLALALSLAIPTLAAPAFSVTIVPSAATGVEDHIYEAYEIFTGDIDPTGTILTHVEWGTGIKSTEFLAELVTTTEWNGKITTTTTAEALADLLEDASTTEAMLLAFRRTAGKHLNAVAATANTKDASGNYVLDLTATGAGYYLIKDQDNSLSGDRDTYTNYMLRVVGQDSLHPKSGTTSIDKVIVDGGSATNVADYSVGDVVSFRVTGTLPMNYSVITPFKYQFKDTLSEGLTFNKASVKMYLENAGEKLELINPTSGTPYFVVSDVDATNSFTVTFENLKAITGRTIDASTNIILEYNAVLNEKAVIGGSGNLNTASIVFSNDPYSGGEGETPEDYAWAFTWELDVTKKTDTNAPLANAKFVFYREKAGIKQYVILDASNKVSGWTPDKASATEIVSPAGGLMPIKGLEADTYYLEETEAPAGYNKLTAPVTVVITAVKGETNFTDLEVKVGLNEVVDGDLGTGIVAGDVINKSGTVLPETGGIGTTIFYILGSTLALGAVVLLITKKRMSA